MSFSVGGLASGLDTKAIIEQLMQLEARPKARKEWNRSLWQAREAVWKDLNGRLLQLQNKATAINNPATWTTKGVTSTDPSVVAGSIVGSNPTAGDYAINVTSLAANEVWGAANALPAATGGVRQSGSWFSGPFSSASGTTLLTNLTDLDGTSLGLDVNSTISLSASVNGSAVSASYTVTSTSTLDDLVQWAETQFPGATFSVNADGTVTYQSAVGGSNEIQSLSFTAVSSTGTSLTVFNGTEGAQSSFVSAPTGGAAADDTLTITQGGTTWNVAIQQGDDEATIARLINDVAGSGVTASVVSGRLQVVSDVAGAAGSFTVASTGTLATDLGLAEAVAGADAQFDVNGTAYTRSKNSGITDVIQDVSIDLMALSGSSVTLTVRNGSADPAEIKQKIKDFVDQYNSVIDYINAKTGEKRVINPKTQAEYLQGPMSRDFRLNSIANDLRRWATDTVSGLADAGNALDDIGISTGAISSSYDPGNVLGRLVIDETKLDAALAADPAKVQEIFTASGGVAGHEDDGVTRRLGQMIGEWRIGGKVDLAMQGASRQVTDLQKTLDRMDDRLQQKRTYYERMFASLETVLGKMQSQGAWLSGQFAALSNGS